MRIGLFTDRYLPQTDGIAYSIESFRIELEKLGHEVYIIAPAPKLRFKESNPHVIRFPAVKGLFFEDYATSLFFPPQTARKLDKLKLDIVHYHTPGQVGLFGAYYAQRNNLPLVTTYHTDLHEYVTHYPTVLPGVIALSLLSPLITGDVSEYRTSLTAIKPERSVDRWNQKIVERSVTMIHNHCDLVIAPSEKMARQLKDWKNKSPLDILPTGVDEIITTDSEIQAFRQRLKLSESDRVILFVGRIGGEKNIELLINAFKLLAPRYADAKLVFVGEGPDRESLTKAVRRDGWASRIIFAGPVNHDQIGAVYRAATIFAFPSLADTQGLVINEAAWASLPIVMIDPHVSEVIRNNVSGLYAKPSAKDLAAKLNLLLANPDLRTRLGEAARERAAQLSAAAQTKKLVALYQQAINHHRQNSQTKRTKSSRRP